MKKLRRSMQVGLTSLCCGEIDLTISLLSELRREKLSILCCFCMSLVIDWLSFLRKSFWKTISWNRSCYWVCKLRIREKKPPASGLHWITSAYSVIFPPLQTLILLPPVSLTSANKFPLRLAFLLRVTNKKWQSVMTWGQDNNSGNTSLGRTSTAAQ